MKLVLALVFTLAALPAAAQAPADTAPRVITNPDWLRMPTGAEIAYFYPERAARMEKSGSVIVECKVKADTTLESCSIVSETPKDYGFGEAVMQLTQYMRMRPQITDGQPVGGATVRIPMNFRID